MSSLDRVVFIVKGTAILEMTIRDVDGYIDKVMTPHGVAPRFHVRGKELWTWGFGGMYPHIVKAFATKAEAQTALDDNFAKEFWSSPCIVAFGTRAAAEKYLGFDQ